MKRIDEGKRNRNKRKQRGRETEWIRGNMKENVVWKGAKGGKKKKG